MKKFTGIIASEKTINTAEHLSRIYPEQDRLINELIDSITYGVTDKDDAYTYIHLADNLMSELFYNIKNDSLDGRDVSDAEYAAIITEIKDIAAELDSFINEYINELIYTFGINE